MTSPGTDLIRDQLAEAIDALRRDRNLRDMTDADIASALVPLVQAAADQRAAEELRKAERYGYFTGAGQQWAAMRVAALAQPAPGETP